MKTKAEILVGYTTVPSVEIGREIAKFLVSERLAACAQVSESPVASYYIWKGEISEDREHVLCVKFSKTNAAQVEAAISRMHPYECPQWYAVEPSVVSQKYASWAENTER